MRTPARLAIISILTAVTGCIAPVPRTSPPPSERLFNQPEAWRNADCPRVVTNSYPDGETRTYEAIGWRRWECGGWTAIDRDLDGRPEILRRKVREKDWMWSSVTEYYQDTDLDGMFDRHYYMLEDGTQHRMEKVFLPAPVLGEPIRKANSKKLSMCRSAQ